MKLHTVFCRGKYRQNEAGNVFLLAFSISKSIGNNIYIYIYIITDRLKITNDKFTDEAFPPVILLVN